MIGKTEPFFLASAVIVIGIALARAQEPARVVIVNNYLLRFFDIKLSGFNAATQQCSIHGKTIIRMDDESVRRKVYEVVPELKTKWFWIGAKRENGNWKWVGDSSRANIDFITWNRGHPKNSKYLVLMNEATYSTVDENFRYAGVICQSDHYCAAHPNPCGNNGTCISGTTLPFYSCSCKPGYYGNNCTDPLAVDIAPYQLKFYINSLKTFDAAKDLCEKSGDNLVRVQDKPVRDKVYEAIKNSSVAQWFWIGATRVKVGPNAAKWKWLGDATFADMTFLEWWPTYPRNSSSNKRDYLAVHKSGKFANLKGTFDRGGVICQKRKEPEKTEFAVNYQLKYFDTKVDGFDMARTLCESEGETLVRMDNERVRSTVDQTIRNLHTVWFWVGATRVEGKWSWLGESSTTDMSFIRWASKYPKNLNYLFIGKNFMYADVERSNPYAGVICQKQSESPCQDNLRICNNGSCSRKEDSSFFHCECRSGFFGETCEELAIPAINHVASRNCTKHGAVEVYWRPNKRAHGVSHRLVLRAMNTTSSDNHVKNTNNTMVLFDLLLPSTLYQLQVYPCPEKCIVDASSTTTVATSVGMPHEDFSRVYMNDDSSRCMITWNNPETLLDASGSKVEVLWSSVSSDSSRGSNGILSKEVFEKPQLSPTMRTSIAVLPNRIYTAEIQTSTGACGSASWKANGSCKTKPKAPFIVLKPNVSHGSNEGLPEITVSLPNETNGKISCVFILVAQGSADEAISSSSNLTDLRNTTLSLEDLAAGEMYLALAIPRRDFTGSHYTAFLGNNKTTSCDPMMTSSELFSIQTQNNTEKSNAVVWAKNWPFVKTTFSFQALTTTPTATGQIYYARSSIGSFTLEQGTSDSRVTVLTISTCVIALLVMLAFGIMWHHRDRFKRKSEIKPSTECEAGSTYQNLLTTEKSTATSISLSSLNDVYKAMKAYDSLQFREEFRELKLQASVIASSTPVFDSEATKTRNRYKNIVPFDGSRVRLQREGLDGYINASYIKGKKMNFIAAQGPMQTTIADFWRMIYEQKVKVVVVLTRCIEGGKRKCEKYWPDTGKIKQHGNLSVKSNEEKNFGSFVRRVFIVSNEEEHEVTQLHFLNWPDHGVPATTSSFFRFHKAVMEKYGYTDGNSPVLVHCSAGVGRTGTFIGYDILQHEGEATEKVDVFTCVMEMRTQRVEMVQTAAQYEMLHRLLLENYMLEDSDMKSEDLLKMKIREASSADQARIETEFQNLLRTESLRTHATENCTRNVVIVRQPEDTERILIDATYIEAFNNASLIAARSPEKSTMEYFWRAVIDNNVQTIVMLDNVGEENMDDYKFAVQYWPETNKECLELNKITVQMVDEQLSEGIFSRELFVTRIKDSPKKIKHYQIIAWASHGIPENMQEVLHLAANISRQKDDVEQGATLIHCIDGVGKTGVMCTLVNIIARITTENRVDIFRTVKDLRDCKTGMVKTLEDYKLCYKAAQDYLIGESAYMQISVFDEEEQIYQNIK